MKEPIRILQVTGIMNVGGTEAMLMNLYREIDKTKIQFDFVENSLEPAYYDNEIIALGGRIYRCPHFNGRNYFQYKKWWHNFFDEYAGDYTAVHGHIGSTAAFYLAEAKRHGIYTIVHSHCAKSSWQYRVLAYPTRYIADHFMGCSTDAGIDRYGKTVANSNKYENFPNAIKLEKYILQADIRTKIRSSLGICNSDIVIGTIGRLTPQKNPMFLHAVFKEIVTYRSDVICLWVGTGEMADEINSWIQRDGLQDKIIMTGVRSDVPDLLQAMDCFLFPSLYEGLPVTIIEAQASGLPCMLSDVIPHEVEITNLIEWHSLKESVDTWSRRCIEIAQQSISQPRHNYFDELRKSGYDITESANRLSSFYLSLVK